MDIYFETQTPQDITYKFVNVSNTFPDNWDLGMCDYTNCYVGVPSSGTMTPISTNDANNGVRGFFKLNVDNMNVSGDGWLKLYVYDGEDFDRGDTVSWHVAFGALSVEDDLTQAAFEVWPNPATNLINITADGNYSGEIYNQLGEQVLSFKSNDDLKTISTSDWAKGLYLITIQNENGTRSSKKVLIQ